MEYVFCLIIFVFYTFGVFWPDRCGPCFFFLNGCVHLHPSFSGIHDVCWEWSSWPATPWLGWVYILSSQYCTYFHLVLVCAKFLMEIDVLLYIFMILFELYQDYSECSFKLVFLKCFLLTSKLFVHKDHRWQSMKYIYSPSQHKW